MIRFRLAFLLAGISCALAQRQPDGAHVNLYFPHFADGGPRTQQWQTTLTFVNAGESEASVWLAFYNDAGAALSLDLGSGARQEHTFTVPAKGVRVLKSRIASQQIVTGWAIALSSVPLQATVAFREIENGVPKVEITAQPTIPGLDYISPASKLMGVAIANTCTDEPVTVDVGVFAEGNVIAGPTRITVPANGHTSFNLGTLFPNLTDAPGVLAISGVDRPGDKFVAWTLNADSAGILSALPPGTVSWPLSHWDRIWLVYRQISDAAIRNGLLTTAPELKILPNKVVNAYASNGETVAITTGLSELISDSPSELAWALAHELGHIYQQRNSGRLEFNANPEFDADIWGTLISMAAGYDPYAAAGALAKLSMATGTSGLATQFENQLAADAHKSFNTRLESVFQMLTDACSAADVKPICAFYKSVVHPHLPDVAPLRARPGARREHMR